MNNVKIIYIKKKENDISQHSKLQVTDNWLNEAKVNFVKKNKKTKKTQHIESLLEGCLKKQV